MALNHRKKTSKQEVLRILRDRILYLELKPGASISDMELAEALEQSAERLMEAYAVSGRFCFQGVRG